MPTLEQLDASAVFNSEREIRNLARVHDVGAHDATVLYASRLLEYASREEVRALGLHVAPGLYANLTTLNRAGRLTPPVLTWAHSLRRLGNAARHIHRALNDTDALVAMSLADRCLDRLVDEWRRESNKELALPLDDDVNGAIEAIEATGGRPESAGELLARGPVAASPDLAALLVERLIDRGDLDGAEAALDRLVQDHPGSVRLQQLWALRHKRAGDLAPALEVLTRLNDANPYDEETAGMLALPVPHK